MLWLFSKYLLNVSKNIFSFLGKKSKIFFETLQVILWQPVVVENIRKDREVHFYVRASSINSIKAQLRQLTIHHKYVFLICCHDCFCKVAIYLTGGCALSLFFSVTMEDVQGHIEKQTTNDTVNPRSSSSYYENYHSMKEVRYFCCNPL